MSFKIKKKNITQSWYEPSPGRFALRGSILQLLLHVLPDCSIELEIKTTNSLLGGKGKHGVENSLLEYPSGQTPKWRILTLIALPLHGAGLLTQCCRPRKVVPR